MPDQNGPIMLSATSVMKQPAAKIGRISKTVTLPRTILVKSLLFGLVYGIIGFIIGLVIGGARGAIYLSIPFIVLSYLATNYSPLKGETFTQFILLNAKSRISKEYINGELVKLHVGITPISRRALGEVVIWPGALTIRSENYDDRGVLIETEKNIYLDMSADN